MSRRKKKRSPELLSQNDVALLDVRKKKKKGKKTPCGWRLASNATVKFIKKKKKNHQGRKLSMDSSFPAISALQPSCASAVTVTICWSKFPRVRRNDGIPPLHRYLRSPPRTYASPCEQLVFHARLGLPRCFRGSTTRRLPRSECGRRGEAWEKEMRRSPPRTSTSGLRKNSPI